MIEKRWIILPIVVMAIGLVAMFFLLGMREEQSRRPAQPRVRVVSAATVAPGAVEAQIVAFGTVLSAQPVHLTAEVDGRLISGDVAFRPAQLFERDDILIRIDDRQKQLEWKSSISDLMNALASVLPEIKADHPDQFGRWQEYFDRLTFTEPIAELPGADNQRLKLLLTRANVFKLMFRVRDLEIELEKYAVKAPFDGTIVSTVQREGAHVRNGSQLGVIISLDSLEVEVPLAATDIPWIDLDGEVVFSSDEMKGEWKGRITRVGRAITAETQTVPVYVQLDQQYSGALPAGLFFSADIAGRMISNAVEVPRRAIYDDNYVYLIRDGQLEYRKVDVVRTQPQSVIVTGGLEVGDTLVVEALQGVSDGALANARLVEVTEGAAR